MTVSLASIVIASLSSPSIKALTYGSFMLMYARSLQTNNIGCNNIHIEFSWVQETRIRLFTGPGDPDKTLYGSRRSRIALYGSRRPRLAT
jgi:hypothetical protein